MEGMYITNWDLLNNASGVSKKINSQIDVLTKAGFRIDVLDRRSTEYKKGNKFTNLVDSILGNSSRTMQNLLKMASEVCAKRTVDFVYVRWTNLDCKQVDYLLTLKKLSPETKVLLELPTFPYDDEFTHVFYRNNDIRARERLINCVDRIITYSNDKEIFGIPTIHLCNGVNYQSVNQKTHVAHEGIHLVAVALFDKWHGYDRVISGMAKDIDLVRKRKIKLFLVGNGRALQKYKELTQKYNLSDHIVFWGEKNGKELDDIFNISDIALDSMGRHRVGVLYNSTLKGKEYCAKGLPVISGVETELDSMSDYPYYSRVPADETEVSVSEIVQFYDRVYSTRTHEEVNHEIRTITQPSFDFTNTFRPIVEYIRNS